MQLWQATVEQEILRFWEFSANHKNLTQKYFFVPLIVYTIAARNAKIHFRKIRLRTKTQKLCVQKFPVLQYLDGDDATCEPTSGKWLVVGHGLQIVCLLTAVSSLTYHCVASAAWHLASCVWLQQLRVLSVPCRKLPKKLMLWEIV